MSLTQVMISAMICLVSGLRNSRVRCRWLAYLKSGLITLNVLLKIIEGGGGWKIYKIVEGGGSRELEL